MGIIALARRYERDRLEAACERALAINAIGCSSVCAILKSGPTAPACLLNRQSHAPARQHPGRNLLSIRKGKPLMLTNPTLEQMQTLRLAAMASAYRQLAEQDNTAALSRDEWFGCWIAKLPCAPIGV